jgi:hypothetical protein
MAFLTEAELKTKSHIEIIEAITEGDDTIVPIMISECISHMKGYLSARYDVDTIFTSEGTDRDDVILKMLKNLVIYEIYASHNPQMMTKIVEDNHKLALEWLKMVQSQKINPDLPAVDPLNPATYMVGGGNPRRTSHY